MTPAPRDDHATSQRDDHATPQRDDHATTPPPDDAPDRNYRRGALAVVPFLAVGLADVALVVAYGVDPVWGLAIVPPIAFICALAWIAFSTEFLEDRTGHGTETHGSDRP